MSLRYSVPLPGPFYYSGRVGHWHWLPRGSYNGFGLAQRERVTVGGGPFGSDLYV